MDQMIEQAARTVRAEIKSGRDPAPLAVETCARQGDCVLTRIGDGQPVTEEAAAQVAEGQHGAHVALGAVRLVGDRLTVGQGGCVVVHTDEPHARHRAVSLRAGEWRVGGLQEIDLEGALQKVRD